MDINRAASQASAPPVSSGGVRAPAPVSRGSTSRPHPAPPVRDVVEVSNEGQAPAAPKALAVLQDNIGSGSRIHLDRATDRLVVEIVNANNEVIRQLPPEEALRIAARFRQITGLIFDRQA